MQTKKIETALLETSFNSIILWNKGINLSDLNSRLSNLDANLKHIIPGLLDYYFRYNSIIRFFLSEFVKKKLTLN